MQFLTIVKAKIGYETRIYECGFLVNSLKDYHIVQNYAMTQNGYCSMFQKILSLFLNNKMCQFLELPLLPKKVGIVNYHISDTQVKFAIFTFMYKHCAYTF